MMTENVGAVPEKATPPLPRRSGATNGKALCGTDVIVAFARSTSPTRRPRARRAARARASRGGWVPRAGGWAGDDGVWRDDRRNEPPIACGQHATGHDGAGRVVIGAPRFAHPVGRDRAVVIGREHDIVLGRAQPFVHGRGDAGRIACHHAYAWVAER